MHSIFNDHSVVIASFAASITVFFFARKKIFSLIDSHIQKAQESLESSEHMKLDALSLLERTKKEYDEQVRINESVIQNAKKKQIADIELAKEMANESSNFQLEHARSQMEQKRLEQIATINKTILSQTKTILSHSMSSAIDSGIHDQHSLEQDVFDEVKKLPTKH